MRPPLSLVSLLALLAVGCRDAPAPDEPRAPGVSPRAVPDTPQPTAPEPAEVAAPGCRLVRDGWGPPGTVPLRIETVVTGLEVPWAIAFLPGGDLLVTERAGRLRRVSEGRLDPQPVLALEVDDTAEGGLLGIALHPDFASNRLFYLYLTARAAGGSVNRVVRFRLAPDGRSATEDRVILGDIPAARFHNGGRLRVGPDRMLYVASGDARQPDLSRQPSSTAGKLLRLTLDGTRPDDAPWPDTAAWVMGLRNVQGFDWLPGGAQLVLADHGPSGELGRRGGDEISVAARGDDLGWPTAWKCGAGAGLVPPVLAFEASAPPGGLAVYTGTAIPQLRGSVLVTTLGSRHLQRVVLDPEDPHHVLAQEVYFVGEPPGGLGRLREAVMGPDGHLYLTTSNCDGRGTCPPDADRILRLLPEEDG